MSSSAFFEHFKAVTGTSPLQYQKDLRLLRARESLRNTNGKVSEIAFGVGYERSDQFSREYVILPHFSGGGSGWTRQIPRSTLLEAPRPDHSSWVHGHRNKRIGPQNSDNAPSNLGPK